jgi:hypothetical protein
MDRAILVFEANETAVGINNRNVLVYGRLYGERRINCLASVSHTQLRQGPRSIGTSRPRMNCQRN